MKIVERVFLRLSPPDDLFLDALGFVPAGSVSSSSTLQNIQQFATQNKQRDVFEHCTKCMDGFLKLS